MNRLFISVLTVFVAVLLVACKPELVSTFKAQDSVTVYLYKNDHVVDKHSFDKKSPGYAAILGWVKKNKSDWNATTATYLPALLIEGNDFSLNVRTDITVFKYQDGQYYKNNSPGDYVWFKNQLGLVAPPK